MQVTKWIAKRKKMFRLGSTVFLYPKGKDRPFVNVRIDAWVDGGEKTTTRKDASYALVRFSWKSYDHKEECPSVFLVPKENILP